MMTGREDEDHHRLRRELRQKSAEGLETREIAGRDVILEERDHLRALLPRFPRLPDAPGLVIIIAVGALGPDATELQLELSDRRVDGSILNEVNRVLDGAVGIEPEGKEIGQGHVPRRLAPAPIDAEDQPAQA